MLAKIDLVLLGHMSPDIRRQFIASVIAAVDIGTPSTAVAGANVVDEFGTSWKVLGAPAPFACALKEQSLKQIIKSLLKMCIGTCMSMSMISRVTPVVDEVSGIEWSRNK